MTSSSRPTSSFNLINYLLLFGAGLIWGSQYILNKIALQSFSTSEIAVGRIGIGALVLTLLLLGGAEKQKTISQQPSFWEKLPDFILIGFLEATLPCLLIAWAQLRLASSVTAILIGTVPLFATLLEFFFLPGSSLSIRKSIGVVMGFCGIVILVLPSFYKPAEISPQPLSSSFWPIIAALISACCFAIAMILIQQRLGSLFGPIRSAQGILFGALVTTVPCMVWATKPWTWNSFHPAFSAIAALIVLGIFCGGIVYTLFVLLINRAGPSFASMTNYLVPPIGAFLGIFFCGETLSYSLIGSLGLILMALWVSSE